MMVPVDPRKAVEAAKRLKAWHDMSMEHHERMAYVEPPFEMGPSQQETDIGLLANMVLSLLTNEGDEQ